MNKWRRLHGQAQARRWAARRGQLRALAHMRAAVVAASTMMQVQMARCTVASGAAERAFKMLHVAMLAMKGAKAMGDILKEAPR